MVSTIKQLIKEAQIKQKTVASALPESSVYTQVVEMPPLSDKELASAMQWEAEQYIPVPLDNVTLDFEVVYRPRDKGSAEKMKVLLVAAPNALIEKYQSIIEESGLALVSLEPTLMADFRVLLKANAEPQILINFGGVATEIAVIAEGYIQFTRSLGVGSLILTRAIAESLGLDINQAEEYKKTYGLAADKKQSSFLKINLKRK